MVSFKLSCNKISHICNTNCIYLTIMFLSRQPNRIKVIYLFIALFVALFAVKVNSAINQSCVVSQPGDSRYFGSSSAINDKYLVVGNPSLNRVVVYTRNSWGKWVRTKEIFPPKGSQAETSGSGFGYDVALDGSTLVIGAYTRKGDPNNLREFSSGSVYETTLDKGSKVERIDVASKEEMPSGIVSASEAKISYSTKSLEMDGKYRVNVYEDGEIKHVFVTSRRTYQGRDFTQFGSNIALKQNFLVVGSPNDSAFPWDNHRGAAWLFNLNTPLAQPRRLAIPNKPSGDTVVISEHFAAVGVRNPFQSPISTQTLVISIKDGSTNLVEGVGKLSSDGNILAMMRPSKSMGGYTQKALLRVYDLTNINKPRLMVKRGGIHDAYVQNNFLVTIKDNIFKTKKKICVQSLSK